MARRLSEVPWFRGIYARIYKVLAVDGYLPPPEGIFLVTVEEAGIGEEDAKRWFGCAIVDEYLEEEEGDRYYDYRLWFREESPDPQDFAHELAHLCQICWRHKSGLPVDDSSKIEEEFFARKFAAAALALAAYGTIPRKSPLMLFEFSKPWEPIAAVMVAFNLGFLANLVVLLFGELYGKHSRLDRMMEAAVEALFFLTGPFVKKLFELSPAVYARMCSYLLS
jgi:hypothetical protein